MDSIRVSEAPDTGSIPVEATVQIPAQEAGICILTVKIGILVQIFNLKFN